MDGNGWIVTQHPKQRHRKKPYLTDNQELGRLFRKKFVNGLRGLIRSGKLKLQDDWSKLHDRQELKAWLAEITGSDWNVFIEGPPHGQSHPEQVLKYLARYLTGGPISDGRIISDNDNRVTFWARSKNKSKGNRPRPFRLLGREFVRRWAMHILPQGYTRSRQFGGYHGRKRTAYLERCRDALTPQLALPTTAAQKENTSTPTDPQANDTPLVEAAVTELPRKKPSSLSCPRCQTPMHCVEHRPRPSWKIIFERRIYEDNRLYSPMHHVYSRAPPAFPLDESS